MTAEEMEKSLNDAVFNVEPKVTKSQVVESILTYCRYVKASIDEKDLYSANMWVEYAHEDLSFARRHFLIDADEWNELWDCISEAKAYRGGEE